ncbi:MAG: hypothetical protein WDZ29_03480 [Balneolaceae bacterium]
MRQISICQATLLVLLLLVSSCRLKSAGPESYSLTTSVQPSDAGSVQPGEGLYEEGSEVQLAAIPNTGWEFTGWSGYVESQENPLLLNLEENVDLTAHFVRIESAYEAVLYVRDAEREIELYIGQAEGAGDTFDPTYDSEVPPAPPEGLYAWLDKGGRTLGRDYRGNVAIEQVWELRIRPGASESFELEWVLDVAGLRGQLMLTDPVGSFQIDPEQSNTWQGSGVETVALEWIYNVEE